MNTHVMLDYEPVADGGLYARAVLLIEGTIPHGELVALEPGRVARSIEAVSRISARNVRVSVRPGPDAEFIQMRHTFDSEGRGNVLTIKVGDVYCLDRIRIRMEALVGSGADFHEAEVGRLQVIAEVSTLDGPAVETIELPIRVSRRHGGRVSPAVSRMPLGMGPLLKGLAGE